MKRLSIILVSAFMLMFNAVNAQSEKDAPVKPKEVIAGSHGGILFTDAGNTMEYMQKGNFLIVFPDDNTTQTAEIGLAKFTITADNKTTVIENVPFKNGMFMADGKKVFNAPKVKFETTVNGTNVIMNFEMPTRN